MHSFPTDIKEALRSCGNIFTLLPISDKFELGSKPICDADIVLLSGSIIGLLVVSFIFDRQLVSQVRK